MKYHPDFFLRNELSPFWKTDANNLVIGVSGGRSSGFLVRKMLDDPDYSSRNLTFVFTNTGKEREESLVFLREIETRWGIKIVWLEAVPNLETPTSPDYKVVDFDSASRNGEPFEEMIKLLGVPSAATAWCSDALKVIPLRKFSDKTFGRKGWASVVGIRIDELSRCKPGKIYPLLKYETTKADVRRFWNSNDFDLALRDYQGNCDLCFKKSKRTLMTLILESPGLIDWWSRIEIENPTREKECGEIVQTRFFRNNQSALDLFADAMKKDFQLLSDPSFIQRTGCDIDSEAKCHCGNEYAK